MLPRSSSSSKKKGALRKRLCGLPLSVQSLVSPPVFVCLLVVALVLLSLSSFPSRQGLPLECKAFVQTKGSSITGTPVAHHSCAYAISSLGGYCICDGDVAVHAPKQRWLASTSCRALCSRADPQKLVQIPDAPPCSDGLTAFSWQPRQPLRHYTPAPRYSEQVTALWQRVLQSFEADDVVVLPPGPRTRDDDFVAKGLRMGASHVTLARKQWARFSDAIGEMPPRAFAGRGIAILAGAAPHLEPALVAVHMIRRAGCELPIELWFASDEVLSGPLVDKLRLLGAHVCTFLAPPSLEKGFYMKAAVVVLSSFEEVLFLDSDQVPLHDVTPLFQSSGYLATGAVLWPDFWRATWARDAARVIDVRRKHMPKLSFESGQMLFNKTRVWPALVTALHFNLQNQLFYPLFSNYMGQGDKETFGMALKAHRMPYHLVRQRPRSLGILARKCGVLWCWDDIVTNTMVQHDLTGQMLFLHTNMKPKWRLGTPMDASLTLRRWQVLNPGVEELVQPWVDLSVLLFGIDIEMYVRRLLVSLRCDPHVWRVHEEYYSQHPDVLEGGSAAPPGASAPTDPPPASPQKLLPFLPEGIQLLNTYERTSLSGPFLRDQPPTAFQVARHWVSYWTLGRGSLREQLSWRQKVSHTTSRYRSAQLHEKQLPPLEPQA